MKPVVVVGSYNTGMTITADRVPKIGETVLGHGYSEGPGGKGSNQAVAASRLGARVRFVGAVGKDRRGDGAFKLWESEGVSAEHVKRVASHTGLAFIVVDGAGKNSIAVDPGANSMLVPQDVEAAAPEIAGAGVVLAQLEIPADSACQAARLARRAGATMILNPAPGRGAAELDLSCVDILTPNETEFAVLTGTRDIDRGAKGLLGLGVKAVVVTLGDRGARVVTGADSATFPAPRVNAVDETGAGDAFNGALAVALSEGEPLAAAVRFANYAGALTVTKPEVIPALPTRKELEEFRRNDALE